ncbi:MAG: hypothetical protein JF619_14455, partial [Massilia sp.]|nr:hypothetical protein [Massilia sp.]
MSVWIVSRREGPRCYASNIGAEDAWIQHAALQPPCPGAITTCSPKAAVFVATCLVAALGSLVMGLYANYPIAMAPGMGLNAYFAYAVVLGMKVPWQAALGAVFVSGCLFILVSVFGLRALIVNGI